MICVSFMLAPGHGDSPHKKPMRDRRMSLQGWITVVRHQDMHHPQDGEALYLGTRLEADLVNALQLSPRLGHPAFLFDAVPSLQDSANGCVLARKVFGHDFCAGQPRGPSQRLVCGPPFVQGAVGSLSARIGRVAVAFNCRSGDNDIVGVRAIATGHASWGKIQHTEVIHRIGWMVEATAHSGIGLYSAEAAHSRIGLHPAEAAHRVVPDARVG